MQVRTCMQRDLDVGFHVAGSENLLTVCKISQQPSPPGNPTRIELSAWAQHDAAIQPSGQPPAQWRLHRSAQQHRQNEVEGNSHAPRILFQFCRAQQDILAAPEMAVPSVHMSLQPRLASHFANIGNMAATLRRS